MKKKPQRLARVMAIHHVWIIASLTLVAGFIAGVAFSAYKLESGSPAGTEASTSANTAQMARSLEAEVAQNPQNANAWIQLGHVYFDSDQYQPAIAAYQKALALSPNNADVLTDLGIMYRRTGQPGQAIESFDRAIQVDPKHETARFNKGIVLMHDVKDRARAIATWEALLAINPFAMASQDQSLDQLLQHYREHETQ
mgnify:CR=1 FL=1